MKETFEDKMTSKFREILENYEPQYSPQAWEKLQQQLINAKVPVRKRISKWYFIAAACLIVSGIFIISDQKSINHSDQNQFNPPITGKGLLKKELNQNHLKAVRPSSTSVSESEAKRNVKIHSSKNSDYLNATNSEKNIHRDFFVHKEELRALSLPVYLLASNKINELQKPERKPLPETKKTLKVKSRSIKIGFKFHEINFKSDGQLSYKNFIGPTQLAIFYNPEIHYTSTTGKMGLSQGIGLELEGPLNSFLSVSGGISFQSNNYTKLLSKEELLLPPNSRQIEDLYRDHKSIITPILSDTAAIYSIDYQFLEAPITLKLAFFKTEHSKFSISAGVSAIFFLKEKYITPFSNKDGLLLSDERNFTSFNNIHPLASFNTGISYRFQLSERIFVFTNLQYKFNLSALGGNEVKINRYNTQFGIVYRFARKE